MKTLMRSLHLATVAALLSACATPPPATVNHPAPPPPPPPVATVPLRPSHRRLRHPLLTLVPASELWLPP